MNWSVSTTKLFQSCPRKYYYQQILAKGDSEDPRVRESMQLKQLNNLYAWRGSLVDGVISRFVVPKINKREPLDEGHIIAFAKDLMRPDFEFLRNVADNKSNQNSQCNFLEVAYGRDISHETIDKVESEIITALKNMLNSSLLAQIIEDNSYLVAQRTLRFSTNGVKVSCTPDLIVFPRNDTPKIIDWKVESIYREHWLQLGIYGVALSKIEPHRDFPSKWHDFIKDPRKIQLIESQLLRNKEQRYTITDDDIVDIEDYIHVTANQMSKLIGDGAVDINQFPTTSDPQACQRCQYKRICWRELNRDSN